ncbi:hypothetical protein F4553_008018 [Allocatelliglobosispora scoriae]|uniref:Uncharacterized protein n=1 Tax=Allocatelliglobosispora scoriae TaxID=643052 RepID=A0A841C2K1_9ACTN|nr:hypothetical protein [Allocatelliglobosispora scoriae]MBB5874584.1 hypothetical protein [Allocatelliglobosispora scoriae]
MTRDSGPMKAAAGVAGLVAASAAAWWWWLGRDTQYQTDPVTGVTSGPYEAWQVIGFVASLAVVAAVGGLLLRPWLVVAAMTLTVTAAWSAQAGSDESGLWVVGAAMVFVGTAVGTAVVAFGAGFLRRRTPRS